MSEHLDAANKLHHYLTTHCWKSDTLIGPDPGIRFNYRIFRFAKSYLRVLPWKDDLYYLQAQSYWVLANWLLYDTTEDDTYRAIAVQCSKKMIQHQRFDGAWEYPNPEWKGRVATAEGVWAALGLLETYRRTFDPVFLDSINHWCDFMTQSIGFQTMGDQRSVNYFANREGARILNNTAFVLRFFAELADVTGNPLDTQACHQMVNFLLCAQKSNGELPYAVVGTHEGEDEPHFQCYQYNAFQCLDLMRYYELTEDELARPLILRVLTFLRTGVGQDGNAHYDCDQPRRTVTYHTAALAAAFARAKLMQIADFSALSERMFKRVEALQRENGSFPHSQGDYGMFSDQRSYPRYLAMILYHLMEHQTVRPLKQAATEQGR